MARRGLTGQLNMFDLFNSLEAPGEVEMVSLVPEFEDEPVAEPEPVDEFEQETEPEIEKETVEIQNTTVEKKSEPVVMSRSYEKEGVRVEIAYLNYNKVRIQHDDKEPEIRIFATSKEAVDFYVEVMQEYEKDE